MLHSFAFSPPRRCRALPCPPSAPSPPTRSSSISGSATFGRHRRVVQKVCDNFNKSQTDYEIVCTSQGTYDATLQNTDRRLPRRQAADHRPGLRHRHAHHDAVRRLRAGRQADGRQRLQDRLGQLLPRQSRPTTRPRRANLLVALQLLDRRCSTGTRTPSRRSARTQRPRPGKKPPTT